MRSKYPCITTNDTIIKLDTSYDFIELQCNDKIVNNFDTIYLTKYKTEIKENKIIGVPVKTKLIYKYLRDSAEINLLEYRLKACQEEKDKLSNKSENKSDWNKWLLVILGISLVINTIQFFKK